MVAHLPLRTHGVNQAFRFVEGFWLHRKSHQIGYFYPKRPIFFRARATFNEQPTTLKTMPQVLLGLKKTDIEINKRPKCKSNRNTEKWIDNQPYGDDIVQYC